MAARKLRMFVDQKPNVFGDRPGYSFVLQDGPTEPVRDSVQFPSSTVVVHRGEPTEITVINRTSGHSSIHWHGIELESFYDGVAGWSGAASRVAPMLAPGDSFIVRMTPDRAGTFIYHTHSDETVQLSSGLYGALLVLEPGQQRDPNERLFLMGEGGPDLKAVPFVNGTSVPSHQYLHGGSEECESPHGHGAPSLAAVREGRSGAPGGAANAAPGACRLGTGRDDGLRGEARQTGDPYIRDRDGGPRDRAGAANSRDRAIVALADA
jgi:hypothetical protein